MGMGLAGEDQEETERGTTGAHPNWESGDPDQGRADISPRLPNTQWRPSPFSPFTIFFACANWLHLLSTIILSEGFAKQICSCSRHLQTYLSMIDLSHSWGPNQASTHTRGTRIHV